VRQGQVVTAGDGGLSFRLDLVVLGPRQSFGCALMGQAFACDEIEFGGTFELSLDGEFSDDQNATATFVWRYGIPETGETCQADLPTTLTWSP